MVVKNKNKNSVVELSIDYKGLIGEHWVKTLNQDNFLESEYMQNLQLYIDEILKGSTYVYPSKLETMFRPFRLVSPIHTQVVIFADEPYRNVNANGLAFGINKTNSTTLLPIQLTRFMETLNKDKDSFDVSLMSWAEQGILLLNTSLLSEIGGHADTKVIFRNFIRQVIKRLEEDAAEIVFVFTNKNQSDTFKKYIDPDFHHILEYDDITQNTTMFEDINNKLFEVYEIKNLIAW